MKYNGIFLADLHIGDMPMQQLEHELKEGLYPYLERKDLDFVIFGGDYFGHRLFLNDENSALAMRVLNEIEKRLKPAAKIRMIYGTKSHDEDQYDSFSILRDRRDFRIIKHVEEEELFPDLHVLYLPEELLYDTEEYYKDIFAKKDRYNLICGHGIIQEIMQKAAQAVSEKKNVSRRVPVFRSGALESICTGLVLFGHYHVHQVLSDRVIYAGSFSRWKFGEEAPKGFLQITYNTEKERNHRWKWKFIENPFAQTYTTIGFGYGDTIFQSTEEMQQKMDHFESLVKSDQFDHLKLEFNIPEDCENAEYYMEFLKERFKRDPSIKVNITNGYIAKRREEDKKSIDADYEKYAPLFDPNRELEDQVSFFVDVEYHKEISPKLTALYLYNSLTDILNTDLTTINEEDK